MPDFIKPEFEELSVHQEMVEDAKTMRFLHKIISFPRTKWNDFYNQWINKDPKEAFYRLVYCPGCEDFVGEAGWKKINQDEAELYMLVKANKREMGYGEAILKMLVEEAEKNGFTSMQFTTADDNPSLSFLEKRGFTIQKQDDHEVTLTLKVGELNCQDASPCEYEEEIA